MKKFSKFMYAIMFALVSVFLIQGLSFSVPATQKSSAVSMDVGGIFNYITISQENQVIDSSHVQVSSDGLTAYVIAKSSTTIMFDPMVHNYSFKIGELDSVDLNTYFYVQWSEEIHVEAEGGSFTYKGTSYNYNITSTNNLQILRYNNTSSIPGSSGIPQAIMVVSSQNSDLLSYNAESQTLKIADSIVLKSAEDLDLTISIITADFGTTSTYDYHLMFLKAVQNFDIDQFIGYKLFSDDSTSQEVLDIKNDETFHKLQFSIKSNDYTEQNPLYININYNGFEYNFVMFSREIEETKYICVQYLDTEYPSNIATKFNQDPETGAYTLDTGSNVYPAMVDGKTNEFVFEFTETGRYELEIYDSTHTYGMANQNYYTSTFYILNKNNTDYNNVYAMAQSIDENNLPIEYINIKSEKLNINGKDVENDIISLNSGVMVTLKNLEQASDLGSVISGITVSRTIFGSSNNLPEVRTYTANEISYSLANKTPLQSSDGDYYTASINDNGEICINFTNDAYYEIYINPAEHATESNTTSYKFQIIKQAKSSFTYFENGVEHDETATTPFQTEIKNPSTNIRSSLNINFSAFTSSNTDVATVTGQTLIKTYVNTYEIRFGVEQVEIQISTTASSVTFTFFGVGDIDVTITINGETSSYVMNSETENNVLTFTEYGTYTCTIVDSMGTTTTNTYTLKQSLNTSAIVLIILSAVILLFVVIFILRARGKVHTK